MTSLRALGQDAIAEVLERSRSSRRRRANLNLHPALDDPIQRFLNVLQPDSYVRPHRHEPARFELFLLLSGRAAMLVFDDGGAVLEAVILAPGAARAAEVAGGAWHTVVALEPDTLLFEVKPGPYRPLTDKDFAAWAPPERDPACAATLDAWRRALPVPG